MTEPSKQLVEALARVNATIHQINGHWWNRRKRPEAPDLHLLLAAIQATDGERQKLRSALEELEGKARLGGDCLGNSPPNFKPCQDSFYLLADIAAAALKEQSK